MNTPETLPQDHPMATLTSGQRQALAELAALTTQWPDGPAAAGMPRYLGQLLARADTVIKAFGWPASW